MKYWIIRTDAEMEAGYTFDPDAQPMSIIVARPPADGIPVGEIYMLDLGGAVEVAPRHRYQHRTLYIPVKLIDSERAVDIEHEVALMEELDDLDAARIIRVISMGIEDGTYGRYAAYHVVYSDRR